MNTDKEFKILQPVYYSKFQCDPGKCHETCCERWKIIIDKNTYQKYINSDNPVIKGIVKTGLSINDKSVGDGDFAIINFNSEMMCPFLNKDGLCEAFINMGEDSLSKTCKTYPRAITLVNGVMERGLEMSCSVASELALMDDKGIKFQHIMDKVNTDDVYIVLPLAEDSKQIEIAREIRTEIICFLQNRSKGLNERVADVGCFLNEVMDDADFSALHYKETLTKIKEAKSIVCNKKSNNVRELLQPQGKGRFHHLNIMLSMKFKEGDSIRFFSKRYIECLMQVLNVFGKVKEKDLENYYKDSYEKYLKPYLNKKSYIMENFLVSYVFVYGAELFKLDDIWSWYLKLCVIYGLLKFNLVGLAAFNKGMNDDMALKLIQSLTKTIITDKTYLKSAIKYLKSEKLIEFSRLIELIED